MKWNAYLLYVLSWQKIIKFNWLCLPGKIVAKWCCIRLFKMWRLICSFTPRSRSFPASIMQSIYSCSKEAGKIMQCFEIIHINPCNLKATLPYTVVLSCILTSSDFNVVVCFAINIDILLIDCKFVIHYKIYLNMAEALKCFIFFFCSFIWFLTI